MRACRRCELCGEGSGVARFCQRCRRRRPDAVRIALELQRGSASRDTPPRGQLELPLRQLELPGVVRVPKTGSEKSEDPPSSGGGEGTRVKNGR